MDPWECCGQDEYCKRGCHEEGGCNNGCIVPKLYVRLAKFEDAALAEPDADVAEAIEELRLGENAWGHGHVFAPTPYTVSLAITALRQYQKPKRCRLCHDEIDIADIDPLCAACINTLEIAQSIQYQKPTDEAVQRAIPWLKKLRSKVIAESTPYEDTLYAESIDTVLEYVRQMRSEPCEWCKDSSDALYAFRQANGEHTTAKKAKHCPNCGRPLKGGE
jgi:hypothetical protein